MNRFFMPREGRLGYPRTSYARLDAMEPEFLEETKEVVFAFDAVDAEWSGFRSGAVFSLFDGPGKGEAYWRARFSGKTGEPPSPFDDLPLYRIEITLDRDHEWSKGIVEWQEEWLQIELDERGAIEADVFGGLFMLPVTARVNHVLEKAKNAEILSEIFDMVTWPDAPRDSLTEIRHTDCELEQLVMFDVGQGSATGLVCCCGIPVCYFDIGCGVFRNAPTCPKTLQFCNCDSPPIVLSHWDADHWGGAAKDRAMLNRHWVAPRQTISPMHAAFANDILTEGGSLSIMPNGVQHAFQWNSKQRFELCQGKGKGRNGTGLVLKVMDSRSKRSWLLTGDVDYGDIPSGLPADLSALVVPHHGSQMKNATVPPSPASANGSYARLLYSFGPGNAHGRTSVSHPRPTTVVAHSNAGWSAPFQRPTLV